MADRKGLHRLTAFAAVLALLLGGSIAVTVVQPDAAVRLGLIAPASCAGNCQGCYCDQIINGTCYVNGRPSGCIGCVGACVADDDCQCRPGRGGCGAVIAWCRDSDCQPRATPVPTATATAAPTPTPLPTATPTPPLCNDGHTYTHIELPTIDWWYKPDYPVAVHQDPTFRGFDLEIEASAGFAESRQIDLAQLCTTGGGEYPADCPGQPWRWVCREIVLEHNDDPIINIDLPMRLADSSVDWLNDDLAQRYYGASSKEGLPKLFELWEGSALYVETGLSRYPAQDPGVHGGKIIVETGGTSLSDPQRVAEPFEVPVYLLDSTLAE